MSEREEVMKCFEVEPGSWEHFVHAGELDEKVKDELIQYYSNNGEMPYGAQTGEDIDPDNWLADKLMSLFKDVMESKPNGERVMDAKTKVQKAIQQLREHDRDNKVKIGSFMEYLMLERQLTKETQLNEGQLKKAMHAVQGMRPQAAVNHLKKNYGMTDDQAGKLAYNAHKQESRQEVPPAKEKK